MPTSCSAACRPAGQAGLDSTAAAAEGVIRIANERMAQALRVISVQRGLDPREFALVSFGGAGGLHVCALAEMLGMRRVLAPIHGGVLSALGMLAAPRGRQLSRTLGVDLADTEPATIETALADLAEQGRTALVAEGLPAEALTYEPSLDLCYRGQSYTLNLAWSTPAACEQAYHDAHEQRFGHRLNAPVQLVNVRMAVRAPTQALALPSWQASETAEPATTRLHGIADAVPVWPRPALAAGQELQGPAIVTETVSTLFLAPGWRAIMDATGNLVMDYADAGKPSE